MTKLGTIVNIVVGGIVATALFNTVIDCNKEN